MRWVIGIFAIALAVGVAALWDYQDGGQGCLHCDPLPERPEYQAAILAGLALALATICLKTRWLRGAFFYGAIAASAFFVLPMNWFAFYQFQMVRSGIIEHGDGFWGPICLSFCGTWQERNVVFHLETFGLVLTGILVLASCGTLLVLRQRVFLEAAEKYHER